MGERYVQVRIVACKGCIVLNFELSLVQLLFQHCAGLIDLPIWQIVKGHHKVLVHRNIWNHVCAIKIVAAVEQGCYADSRVSVQRKPIAKSFVSYLRSPVHVWIVLCSKKSQVCKKNSRFSNRKGVYTEGHAIFFGLATDNNTDSLSLGYLSSNQVVGEYSVSRWHQWWFPKVSWPSCSLQNDLCVFVGGVSVQE